MTARHPHPKPAYPRDSDHQISGRGQDNLLNRLLREPDSGRVAEILDTRGEIGLDHDPMESAAEEMGRMQSAFRLAALPTFCGHLTRGCVPEFRGQR